MDSIDSNSVAPPNPTSVITNCTISGHLPKFEAFAINYPGYPSSTSRAIHTLGGLEEISKVRSSGSSQLELRFRPDDPYCHPAFAECRPFAGLLLKISKTRPESDNNEGTLNADVVARVNQAYHFEGMVDYQYVLPVHAAEARRKKRRCVFDEETDLEKEADVMMLVPSLFSPKDKPEELVLNPPANLFSKSMQRGVVEHRWEKKFTGKIRSRGIQKSGRFSCMYQNYLRKDLFGQDGQFMTICLIMASRLLVTS